MAYDEDLAERVRALLAGEDDLREQRMFGGLAFLVAGSMAVAVRGRGGLMVRVDPDRSVALVESTAAEPMEMRGRLMNGWLTVDAAGVEADDDLARWVGIGLRRARALGVGGGGPGDRGASR
ncbi:MAG: TfoX/Sxy family protein [Thermoleophilia bacterium]